MLDFLLESLAKLSPAEQPLTRRRILNQSNSWRKSRSFDRVPIGFFCLWPMDRWLNPPPPSPPEGRDQVEPIRTVGQSECTNTRKSNGRSYNSEPDSSLSGSRITVPRRRDIAKWGGAYSSPAGRWASSLEGDGWFLFLQAPFAVEFRVETWLGSISCDCRHQISAGSRRLFPKDWNGDVDQEMNRSRYLIRGELGIDWRWIAGKKISFTIQVSFCGAILCCY